MRGSGWAFLIGIVAFAAASRAAEPCPDGRFVVEGARLLASEDDPIVETIVVERGTVSVNSGCDAVPVKVKARKKATRLTARFTSCLGTKARLKVAIDAETCGVMHGRLRLAKGKPKRRTIDAVRAPYAYDVPVDPRSP